MKLQRERLAALAGVVIAFFVLAGQCRPQVSAADRITLRNLQVITARTVVSFDEDAIRLDDNSQLTWDEIEKATIAPDRQAAFDKFLSELGTHLYRIRQRLTTGDYEGSLAHAEAVYPRYATRTSDTAYMVTQCLMWGRIATGQREAAVEPYLRCYNFLRARGKTPVALPGERRLQIDPKTGLTPDLAPVWFNSEAARQILPEVFRRISEIKRPRPEGAYIYYVTLALAAGDDASAEKVIAAIQSSEPSIAELRVIIDAQREVLAKRPGEGIAKLATTIDSISPANRALATYWLGMSGLQQDDPDQRRRGMLQLLRIPALQGRENPELAAAALFRVMNALATTGDARGSVAVRRELLERYGQTYFAAQLKSNSTESSGTEETP